MNPANPLPLSAGTVGALLAQLSQSCGPHQAMAKKLLGEWRSVCGSNCSGPFASSSRKPPMRVRRRADR